MTESQQYCTFLVCDQCFGIPVEDVREVLSSQHITPVPLSPEPIEGLMNIRGHIITALEMRAVLGLPEPTEQSDQMNVVVSCATGEAALVVDEISDIVSLDPDSLEPVPATVSPRLASLVPGVFALENTLLLALDASRLLDDPRFIQGSIHTASGAPRPETAGASSSPVPGADPFSAQSTPQSGGCHAYRNQ